MTILEHIGNSTLYANDSPKGPLLNHVLHFHTFGHKSKSILYNNYQVED